MKFFYRPAYFYLIVDILIVLLSFYVVLDWFPLTTHTPFEKYSWASLTYIITWIVISYSFKRYLPLRRQPFFNVSIRLNYTVIFISVGFYLLIHFFFKPYSGFVLLAISLAAFIINYLLIALYFAYRFAVEYNEITFEPTETRENAKVKPAEDIDDESLEQIKKVINKHAHPFTSDFFSKYINLKSGNTHVFINTEPENLQMIPNYTYSAIIQLETLNNMRGINKKLSILNEKLPDDGIFVCCYESKSTRKMRFFQKYPVGINYLLYIFDFLFKRVMPKFVLTRGLYYFITGGKNRIFSKAEVLGRLYCFGFNVIRERKVGKLNYVFAQRVKQPETYQKRIYGLLIRLKRFGKGGKSFDVYKMRTMHPYSEYLQAYIFENNSLKEGGKFNKDIRITTLGKIVRKYWLDELPMILNLLRGEMKLVGVRPLSQHYFSLYTQELQAKRIKYRPGLLPPFYADMPSTLDEIQESEMKYLNACEKNGVFKTDIRYLFLILKNILFKKARSG
jgi:lipopolysaccharide/colanic/teichoic acid biosynthesis glycosyltransferase